MSYDNVSSESVSGIKVLTFFMLLFCIQFFFRLILSSDFKLFLSYFWGNDVFKILQNRVERVEKEFPKIYQIQIPEFLPFLNKRLYYVIPSSIKELQTLLSQDMKPMYSPVESVTSVKTWGTYGTGKNAGKHKSIIKEALYTKKCPVFYRQEKLTEVLGDIGSVIDDQINKTLVGEYIYAKRFYVQFLTSTIFQILGCKNLPSTSDCLANSDEIAHSLALGIICDAVFPRWLKPLTWQMTLKARAKYRKLVSIISYANKEFIADELLEKKENFSFIANIFRLYAEEKNCEPITLLDEQKIWSQALGILNALDNLSTMLTISLIFLTAENKCVIREEICSNTENENSEILNLFYIEMLRYLSLVPITVRLTTRDLPLSKEIKIPKGSTCLIDLSWSAFHGSWPDPENFNLKNAEYFLNLNEKEQSNMLFKPFSDSPHLCYGQVLVGAIFKKTIYKMLKEYSFSTNYQGNFFPRKNGRISISQQDVKLHFRAATAASQGSEALASSPR